MPKPYRKNRDVREYGMVFGGKCVCDGSNLTHWPFRVVLKL
jgi:hypothetical protein